MSLEILDWGVIDYQMAWDKQKELVKQVQESRIDGYLVYCQHPSVITMGKNGTRDNLKVTESELNNKNIKVIDINRGGDVTLHNPGQIVGYPIVNLQNYKQDLHWFLRTIESSLISTLKNLYDIEAGVYDRYTGVWIEKERKIAAIGMHCSRWVTSHGFALNVENDISEFEYIVPCGIEDKEVTSIAKEFSKNQVNGMNIDIKNIQNEFSRIFQSELDASR